jgi:plasmid maintenance system antidote protein VapI
MVAPLREELLPAMEISLTELARSLRMSRQSLHRILAKEPQGIKPISA